jgi:hypothetical protein
MLNSNIPNSNSTGATFYTSNLRKENSSIMFYSQI